VVNQLSSLWNVAGRYLQEQGVMSGPQTVRVNKDGVFDVNTRGHSSLAHF